MGTTIIIIVAIKLGVITGFIALNWKHWQTKQQLADADEQRRSEEMANKL